MEIRAPTRGNHRLEALFEAAKRRQEAARLVAHATGEYRTAFTGTCPEDACDTSPFLKKG
jgi:hypothetical protein